MVPIAVTVRALLEPHSNVELTGCCVIAGSTTMTVVAALSALPQLPMVLTAQV